MNRAQKLLLSEINTVKKFISETPEESVIDRISMEGRLKELREELENISKKQVRKK